MRADTFALKGLHGRYRVRVWTVDDTRGNALYAWRAMGAPDYPKAAQIEALRASAEPVLLRDETLTIEGEFTLKQAVAPCALVFFELARC